MIPRIMALDYGEKMVGLALSDPLGITAQPLETIRRETDAQVASEIEGLAKAHEVERIIVGLPLNLSGGHSPQTKRTRRFISRLRKLLYIKVEACDERLSSSEAERALVEMDVRRSRRKERRDTIAAQLILQGYLDLKSAARPRP